MLRPRDVDKAGVRHHGCDSPNPVLIDSPRLPRIDLLHDEKSSVGGEDAARLRYPCLRITPSGASNEPSTRR